MKPFIIGITGGSGGGKTSFIRAIRKAFSASQICLISQDDYYLPREAMKADPNGVLNFDLPDCFDKKAFNRDLEKLINGESYERTEYIFNNAKSNPKTLTFHPAPIIIVEGLFVFHFKKIFKHLDLKIFVDTEDHLKLTRRIVRDQVERNYPLDEVLYQYQHHVMPSYQQYIEPYRREADIVVNNNHNFEKGLDVVIGFLKQKCSEEL